MKRLYGLFAVVAVVVILALGLSNSWPSVQAQAGKQVTVTRVKVNSGMGFAQTNGPVVGFSCVEVSGASPAVECFVASTN